MYTLENLKTFAEINSTTQENISLVLSAITVNTIGVLYIDSKGHSNKYDLFIIIEYVVGTSMANIIAHVKEFAVL
jgi:hypothetical protein